MISGVPQNDGHTSIVLQLRAKKEMERSEYPSCIFPDFPFEEADKEEDIQWKTIYSLFGMSVFRAQGYEDSLIKFVIEAESRWGKTGLADEKIKKLTLGKLQKEYSKYCNLPEARTASMKNALEKRNSLVHSFYRKRADKLSNHAGRKEVIEELMEIINLLIGERDDVYWNSSFLSGEIV